MNALAEHITRARILDVTEEQYFADPCSTPSLSQSIAHTLITESPLHAWCQHPRFGAEQNPEDGERDTGAIIGGKVIHKLLLGKGGEVDIIEADNFRTKIAREARDAAVAAGRVPMLARVHGDLVAAAETIKGNLHAFGIDLDNPRGQSEVAIEWSEEGVHGPVLCRGRLDRVDLERGVIYDIKKIRSAHPEQCGKSAIEYGADIQNSAYVSALSKLRPELAGRIEMIFINVEIDPPYAIYPGPLDGELRMLGDQRWQRAIFVWEECLRSGRWPAYTDRITPIRAPGWAVTRWMERAQDW